LGERAGNAALEEIVMALRTRKDFYGCDTGINAKRLHHTSRLVASITGIHVPRNKAIVGANAFAHEAGIHQHGVLMEPTTYEIMRPQDVGLAGTNLVLGKHSGRHALARRIEDLGFHLGDEQLRRVLDDFKRLADKKKEVYDADLVALVEDQIREAPEIWKLVSLHTSAGTGSIPTATLSMQRNGEDVIVDAATGDGPIDAVFKAIERITGKSARLSNYQVRSVTGGKDAQGEVVVAIAQNDRVFRGVAVSTDVIDASARAYLQAINKLAAAETPVAPAAGAAATSAG
ncbi:MAG: alpha-isopropylmalate synthase regulatory domain-containing protein, partial [Pirellulales bacterium]